MNSQRTTIPSIHSHLINQKIHQSPPVKPLWAAFLARNVTATEEEREIQLFWVRVQQAVAEMSIPAAAASLGVATAEEEAEVVEEEMEGVEEVAVGVDLVPTETTRGGLSFLMISWSLRSWS